MRPHAPHGSLSLQTARPHGEAAGKPKLDGATFPSSTRHRSLAPTVIRVIVTVAIAFVALVATAAVTLYALLVIDSRKSVRHYYGDTPAGRTPEHRA